ncbi:MAG: hydrolase [Peptococcaceae bacterium]|nr:hydrolase [Peptococcaceae bacterium]
MEFYRELTSEEKAKPYSKYFYKEPKTPDPEKLALMDKPIDPSKALPIENRNDLLNPGNFEVEVGWCVLPDGVGYVANRTLFPGVTAGMIKWWFAWHALEDLRYKIWFPKAHYGTSVDDAARKKILDPDTPIDQKIQGVTHHVIEDIGGGAENIEINFLSPEDFGFDMSRYKAPNVAVAITANGVTQKINPPPGVPNPKAPATMCHFFREIPGGLEMRTRFWMGMHIIDKKPVKLLPDGFMIPEFVPRGLAVHNVWEYTNLASILPQLYEEQKGLLE